jgi:hypothetical protein
MAPDAAWGVAAAQFRLISGSAAEWQGKVGDERGLIY